ncbi:MAG: glycosyltransferase, partial [Bacteroidota bacterium]|nr:glycosyltransferase [Bacteroidota bacterium]
EQLPKNISINYKGTIKKSFVNQTFSKYHFSFMPSKGENFGHSILESFMSGTPVITSSNTPWKELEQMNVGWDIDLNNSRQFVSVINYCSNLSQEKYDEMSKNAFVFAKEFSNNPELIEKTKMLFYE